MGAQRDDPGSDPSSDPSSDPGSDPGSDPSSDPGSDPGFILSLSQRSLSFFSISTITACFCDVDNSPLSKHSFAHLIKESLITNQFFL